jgi:hypothetical protein
MHQDPSVEQHASTIPAPVAGTSPSADPGAIVEHALASTVALPPERRGHRPWHRTRAATPATVVVGGSRSGGSHAMRMVAWALFALLALGAGAVMTGAIQLGAPGSGPTDVLGGTRRDGAWSYYHDTSYDAGSGAAKWSTDRSRSSDPNEAVLGDTTRWEYDGPYRYGPYGSDGIRQRASGRERVDPLYSSPAPLQDVFSRYGGDLDPSGGQPVGVAPSSMTTPYYNPYAGYANPYANRIRMAYGEGVGRGASYDPLGP